ncbi:MULTISPECIES: hypothetical protein [Actinosynnema]|uniref:hypothetical protein n=1 Tax=Actinosynnema TaxID=40566 RepID=UPI0020A45C68|nr:hypothetical protein [Actinosynnema pretiosum]MCP2097278.1 hypothetical protein [Actinosynnema pretiosum]
MTGTGTRGGRNERLAACLDELGWTPGRLARELNTLLGARQVARSTVVGWIGHGRLPHDPLPTVTAHLLAEATGRPLDAADLWGPRARPSPTWTRADAGLPPPHAPRATVETAAQWAGRNGDEMNLSRRTLLAISGPALISAAFADTTPPPPAASTPVTPPGPADAERVTPALADFFAGTVTNLRDLDDDEGGGALPHARAQFALLADHVRRDHYTDTATRRRTVHLWAQMAATVGWMAMDAGHHGLAQRYFLTGLRAAHHAADPALGSHLYGCLAYQAIARDRLRDALAMANAAITTARTAPPATKALAAARHAHVHAALGDLHGLHRSTDEVHTHLEHPDALTTRPPWLYWMTNLRVVTGQNLITAGFADHTPDRRRTELLTQATPLLSGWLGSHAEHTADRDGLLHGAWLARSYLRQDRLDPALATTRSLIPHITGIRSTWNHRVLHALATDLDTHHLHGHTAARQARDALRAALPPTR